MATTRFETPPGYQLQIDFGQRQVWIGGEKRKVSLFVATLGCSRRMHVRVFVGERQAHWFAGLESTFEEIGGVPETVLLDNAKALRSDAGSGLPPSFPGLREALGVPAASLRSVSGADEGEG